MQVRYIRDWLNGSTANTGNHWIEIQAYDGGTNRALGKSISASGTIGGTGGTITDGVTATTPYSSVGTGAQWMKVDLGASYDIDYLRIWHYYSDHRTYHSLKTEVSTDNSNWYPVFDSSKAGEYRETNAGLKHYLKMTPISGVIGANHINYSMGYSISATMGLNSTLIRKLAAKTSGVISYNDLHAKMGHTSRRSTYTHTYPWTPPATQSYSAGISSPTTAGTYTGTLSKDGSQWNSYGSYAWYGTEKIYQDNTTSPTAVGTQIGATWISGTYEYRWVVNRWVTGAIVNYQQQYDTYQKQQRRLITVYQMYSGTVYLRG